MSDIAVRQTPDVMTLGTVFAKSGYFQDARDAAQAVVKMLAGQELGFGPVASMTGIFIVKGRVTLSANLQAAAVKRSGKYNYRVMELTDHVCKLDFFERGDKGWDKVGESAFTLEDAKIAGLVNDNYKKFPRNMLFARAMSNGAKWYCADVFGGPVYTPDELGATVDAETGEMLDRPADEKILPTASVAVDDEGPAEDAAAARRNAPLFPAGAHEDVNTLLGRITAGFSKLKYSPVEQQAVWSEHCGDAPLLSAETDVAALAALLADLRARAKAAR